MYRLIENAIDYCPELKNCDNVHEVDNEDFPEYAVACGTAEVIKGEHSEIKRKYIAVFMNVEHIKSFVGRIGIAEYYDIPKETFLYGGELFQSLSLRNENIENMVSYLRHVIEAQELKSLAYLENEVNAKIISDIRVDGSPGVLPLFEIFSKNSSFWMCNLSKASYAPHAYMMKSMLKERGMTDMIKMPCELSDEDIYAIHNNISREFPDTFQNDEQTLYEKISEDEHFLI